MSNTTQRYLRFLIPGMLGYIAIYYICLGCDFCNIEWPNSIDEMMKLTYVFVISVLYNIFNIRRIANSLPFFKVDANIMERLKTPFLDIDKRISDIEWKDFKDIYYPIIDNDETLKIRSENIRFNGTIWSSAADLRAISSIAALFLILCWVAQRYGFCNGINEEDAIKSIIVLICVFIISFPVSYVLTVRHRRMVIEQCDYILLHKRDELERGIKELVRKLH